MSKSRVLCLTAALFTSTTLFAQVHYDEEMCGSLDNHYGPFDYRTASSEQKLLVEGAHFNRDVENLKGYLNLSRGHRAPPGADIDYTLRVFPNHPRALYAFVRLEEKEKTSRPQGSRWPVPCYFARAVTFAPDDASVRLVYGIYLLRRGAKDHALRQFEAAHEKAGDDPNLNYNLGLAYFDAAQYDRSLEYAKKAYALGFPLDGLKNKLKKAGKWQD